MAYPVEKELDLDKVSRSFDAIKVSEKIGFVEISESPKSMGFMVINTSEQQDLFIKEAGKNLNEIIQQMREATKELYETIQQESYKDFEKELLNAVVEECKDCGMNIEAINKELLENKYLKVENSDNQYVNKDNVIDAYVVTENFFLEANSSGEEILTSNNSDKILNLNKGDILIEDQRGNYKQFSPNEFKEKFVDYEGKRFNDEILKELSQEKTPTIIGRGE